MAAHPEHGGMGLPMTLATAVDDMMSGACLALQLKPLLTQGQIEALEHHASDALKALYLPKLISGEWSGTMNLTEPQAGSDVGALRTKAEPNGDGTYAITGQKIYITWGDSDLVGERLPPGAGAAAGRRPRDQGASACSWCRSSSPTRTGNPGAAQQRCGSSAWSTSWASTAARPA